MNLQQLIVDFVEGDVFQAIVRFIDSLGLLYLFLLWFSLLAFFKLRKRLGLIPKKKIFKLVWIFTYAVNGVLVYRLFSPATLIINVILFIITIVAGYIEIQKRYYRDGVLKVLFGSAQLVLLIWSNFFGRIGILIVDIAIVLLFIFVLLDTIAKFEEFDELEEI